VSSTVPIVALCGGVGAARFLRGLVRVADPGSTTAIVNVGDDTILHGLAISPDLDTITYSLAGLSDDDRGWGLAGETWHAMAALGRLAGGRPAGSKAGSTWFSLGDRDLAMHLYRTGRLAEGAALSTVTAEVGRALGVGLNLLPVTDDALRTRVTLAATGEEVGFQEWFVGMAHSEPVAAVRFDGAGAARPAPGVVAAIEGAARIVVCPSNPIVSIDPVLAVAGVRSAVEARRDDCVAISPIVAGAALKGPAARMLTDLGHEASVVGIARLYASLASTLVIDGADADLAAEVERAGMRCVVTDTVMHSPEHAATLARAAIGSEPT
jgi:LPPG:FO 2-phospho-L-lactate transferase